MRRLIISLYDNFGAAHEAVKQLVDRGFHHDSISLIAHQAVCERIWSGDRSKSWFFLSQPCTTRLPAIGAVLVSGFLANDPNLDETGPKSLVRALERQLVPKAEAHVFAEGVRRRGILVIVRAERATSNKALFILDQYCPVDTQNLAEQWRRTGWTGFDDTARPLLNHGVNWPGCITSFPGDEMLDDGILNNWPQNIAKPRIDRS